MFSDLTVLTRALFYFKTMGLEGRKGTVLMCWGQVRTHGVSTQGLHDGREEKDGARATTGHMW